MGGGGGVTLCFTKSVIFSDEQWAWGQLTSLQR